MMNENTRKAIQDAVLAVQDYAKEHGAKAAARRDWRTESLTLAPPSVSVGDRPTYRETFQVTAELSASLLASFA